MKRIITIILLVCVTVLVCPKAEALKYYNRYLAIENGKSQIIMTVGERKRLRTTQGVFSMPAHKNLEYNSTNSIIATVDNSGIVNANMRGRAYITVTDENGRTDSILIVVENGRKPFVLSLVIIAVTALFIIILINKIRAGSL